MNRLKKTIVFTVLSLALVFSATANQVFTSQASSEPIHPNKTSVDNKVHSSEIESYNYDNKLTEGYLNKLNVRELLEVVAEYSTEETKVFNASIYMVSPHLKNKMNGGSFSKDLSTLVKDKTYNATYRLFLIDFYSNMKSLDQNDLVSETLITIATDESENDDIRWYALGELKQESKNKVIKDKQDKRLADLFYDAKTSDKIKGSALTAMRRTNNPLLLNAINSVLNNQENKDSLLIRHAVVSAGKSGLYDGTNKIKRIAKNTLDPEVYASSVYALGLLGSKDSLKAILEVYGKHNNNDIGYGVLTMKQKLILDMLNNEQSKENILDAIKAAELIGLHSALDNLQEISNNSLDSELRTKASDAYKIINEIPRSGFPSNAEKWED